MKQTNLQSSVCIYTGLSGIRSQDLRAPSGETKQSIHFTILRYIGSVLLEFRRDQRKFQGHLPSSTSLVFPLLIQCPHPSSRSSHMHGVCVDVTEAVDVNFKVVGG